MNLTMTTAQQERPTPEPSWDEHYRDERDAAFLYRQLAGAEGDPERRGLFERLAVVEDRHVSRWEELFHEGGRPLPAYKTALRTRALAWSSSSDAQARTSASSASSAAPATAWKPQ